MKILITGAGGFVGKYLIKELQKDTANEIFGAVYNSTSDIKSLISDDHIFEGDLTKLDFAKKLLESTTPDIIYHLAALSVVHNSSENAIKVLNGNTAVSYNVLESMRLFSPKARFVAICSANEYGAVSGQIRKIGETTPLRPLNPYAVSKVTQEMLALEYHFAHGLDTVILRPFNHTGIGQTEDFVVPRLAKQFIAIEQGLSPATIEVGNLSSIRDFTDVRDMVKAYRLAGEMCESGEIYNIGTGVGHSIAQLLDIFNSLVSKKVDIIENRDLSRSADVPFLIADSTKFQEITGWLPVHSIERTISDILNHYRQLK